MEAVRLAFNAHGTRGGHHVHHYQQCQPTHSTWEGAPGTAIGLGHGRVVGGSRPRPLQAEAPPLMLESHAGVVCFFCCWVTASGSGTHTQVSSYPPCHAMPCSFSQPCHAVSSHASAQVSSLCGEQEPRPWPARPPSQAMSSTAITVRQQARGNRGNRVCCWLAALYGAEKTPVASSPPSPFSSSSFSPPAPPPAFRLPRPLR